MADPIPTTGALILDRVIARIRDQVTQLNSEVTCFLSIEPEPEEGQIQNLACLVSPMSGFFDDSIMTGAGSSQVMENTGVITSIWSNMRLDRSQVSASVLNETTRGLMAIKKQLLKALAGHYLLDASGNRITTDCIKPSQAQYPKTPRSNGRMIGFSMYFDIQFEWDLT